MFQNQKTSAASHMKAKYNRLLLLPMLFCSLDCSRPPEMVERLPPLCGLKPNDYNEVPVILVGVMTEGTTPVSKFHPARYNSQLVTRRYRVKMKVENVLQGDVTPGETVNIFFFADTRSLGSSGSPMHFPPGTREMFFLQRDYGELRTIRDQFSNNCATQVLSGAHPDFERNLSKPVIEDAVNLLLTRGQGTSDKQMVEAVYEASGSFLLDIASRIKKFQEVAKRETPPVRAEACSLLKLMHQSCEESIAKKDTVRE